MLCMFMFGIEIVRQCDLHYLNYTNRMTYEYLYGTRLFNCWQRPSEETSSIRVELERNIEPTRLNWAESRQRHLRERESILILHRSELFFCFPTQIDT
jgi:hypothetical protein